MKKLRCAIYTRKSSEDGLEQEFNSLDAQREACAAYIASQKHEGWMLLSEHYDDGGLSGGSLERHNRNPLKRRRYCDQQSYRLLLKKCLAGQAVFSYLVCAPNPCL